MKKLVTRFMVFCTLSVCLGVVSSTSISARPQQCQSGCFDWFQCETVLNPETGLCVPTRCDFNFACVLQDTLEQPETGPEIVHIW